MIKKNNEMPFRVYAHLLARRVGLEVSVGGGTAYASIQDGQARINIPAFSPDKVAETKATWGYVYHEAAHITDSDFELFRSLKNPIHQRLLNIVEDIRNEWDLPGKYLTAGEAIQDMNQLIFDRDGFCAPAQGEHPSHIVCSYVLLSGLLRNGLTAVNANVLVCRDLIVQTFGSKCLKRIDGILNFDGLASTGDCYEKIVLPLMAVLENLSQQSQSSESSSDGSESSDSSDGSDSSDSSSDGSESSDLSSDGSESSDSSSDGSDSSDSSSDGSGLTDDSQAFSEAARAVIEASESDLPTDKTSVLEAVLSSYSDVYDMAFGPGKGGSGLHDLAALAASSLPYSRQQARHLKRLLTGDEAKGRLRSSGRLVGSRSSRILNSDPKLFKRPKIQKSNNTDFHVLLDTSASMNNDERMVTALAAAMSLTKAIQSIPSASLELTGFGNSSYQTIQTRKAKFTPLSPAWNVKARGGTPLLQAMQYAYAELASRSPKNGKVLLVITDGTVSNTDSINESVNAMNAMGYVTCFLGIQTASMGDIDAISEVISEVSQMENAMFGIVNRVLAA